MWREGETRTTICGEAALLFFDQKQGEEENNRIDLIKEAVEEAAWNSVPDDNFFATIEFDGFCVEYNEGFSEEMDRDVYWYACEFTIRGAFDYSYEYFSATREEPEEYGDPAYHGMEPDDYKQKDANEIYRKYLSEELKKDFGDACQIDMAFTSLGDVMIDW